MDPMQIVIAWAERTRVVPTPGFACRDANVFAATRLDWEARAATWVREGTAADLAKAEAFAASQGHSVHTFPVDEENALDEARRRTIDEARARTCGEGGTRETGPALGLRRRRTSGAEGRVTGGGRR